MPVRNRNSVEHSLPKQRDVLSDPAPIHLNYPSILNGFRTLALIWREAGQRAGSNIDAAVFAGIVGEDVTTLARILRDLHEDEHSRESRLTIARLWTWAQRLSAWSWDWCQESPWLAFTPDGRVNPIYFVVLTPSGVEILVSFNGLTSDGVSVYEELASRDVNAERELRLSARDPDLDALIAINMEKKS